MQRSDYYGKSDYFKADDVKAAPIVATIHSVREKQFSGDTQPKPMLIFKDQAQMLTLNVTNFDIMEAAFGEIGDGSGWVGKTIEMCYDPTVQYKGKSGGLQVRIPEVLHAAKPVGDLLDYPTAIALCKSVGIEQEQMVNALKAKGQTGGYSAKAATPIVRAMVAAETSDGAGPGATICTGEIPF